MPGARMIFNARYFQITKPGEAASKNKLLKTAAAGLVEYIATRESVIHNFTPEYELADTTDLQRAKIEEFLTGNQELKTTDEYDKYHASPTAANATRLLTKATKVIAGIDTGEAIPPAGALATEKQRQRIQEFLSAAPGLKESMEYLDFLEHPSFENASEFLSNAFENSMGSIVDTETLQMMVNYIATRPGVVAEDDHGLFSGDSVTDLEAYKQEVSEHSGNIYSTVVSLRREDADRMGFDTQAPWRDVVLSKLDIIAKNSNIPLQDLRWCAAMHNTGHHPHIHLMYWSEHPDKQNFLSKNGIEKIKSAFAHEIFRGEFEQIYEQQKTITNDLKEECVRLFDQLNKNVDTYAGAPNLIEKFSVLSGELQELKGKHQYKYLPGQLKALVNDMVDTIGEIPEIKRIHLLYEEQHNKMLSIYKNQENIPTRMLSEIKSGEHLYFLKNLVLRAANQFSQQHPEFYTAAEPDAPFQPEDPPEDLSDMFPDDSPDNLIHESEQLVQQLHYAYHSGNSEAALLLGEIFAEGLPGIEADLDTAMMWYRKEADQLPQAAYRLSEMAPDAEQSGMYTHLATLGFLRELENSPNSDIIQAITDNKYRYGNMEKHYQIEYDTLKSIFPDTEYQPPAVVQDSPENGERLFYLAKLQAKGYTYHPDFAPTETRSVPPDIEKAKDLLQLTFEAGYAAAAHALGGMEESSDKSLRWYLKGAEAGHVDSMQEAARLLKSGEGGIQDLEAAAMLYERTAQQEASQHAEALLSPSDSKEISLSANGLYRQAKSLEKEKANLGQAFVLFKQAANDGDAWAQYKTAEYLNDGTGTEKNPALAQEYYAKALQDFLAQNQENPDAWLQYRIAGMYEHGKGTDQDTEKAFQFYQLAADGNHTYAQYKTAEALDSGTGTEKAPALAQEYYSKSLHGFLTQNEENPDAWVQYRIAGMYEHGNGCEKDPEKAFQLYRLAADGDHTYAQYKTAETLDSGTGTEKDPALAQEYYAKALQGFLAQNQESPDAQVQYRTAEMYMHGKGCDTNASAAFQYYKQAANTGHTQAAFQVGYAYHTGNGVPVNETIAQRYFQKAFQGFMQQEQQKPDAFTEFQIGRMYERGFGTEKDRDKAQEWYQKSADNGSEYAQQALERMEQKRSAEIQAAATSALQALLRACTSQMRQELRRPLGIDRKERRNIREKKHSMGMLEDWEQTIE